MMFLFSTSDKIGAKAIRWALDEPCSHFAIVFDEREDGYGVVFHSHLSGVQFDWFRSWHTQNKIVYALRPKSVQLLEEERIYQAIVSQFYGKRYDAAAFVEFGVRALRRKLFGTAIPARSSFGQKDAYLCTEIAPALQQAKPEYFSAPLTGDLTTPYALFNNMNSSKDLERVPWISDRKSYKV